MPETQPSFRVYFVDGSVWEIEAAKAELAIGNWMSFYDVENIVIADIPEHQIKALVVDRAAVKVISVS